MRQVVLGEIEPDDYIRAIASDRVTIAPIAAGERARRAAALRPRIHRELGRLLRLASAAAATTAGAWTTLHMPPSLVVGVGLLLLVVGAGVGFYAQVLRVRRLRTRVEMLREGIRSDDVLEVLGRVTFADADRDRRQLARIPGLRGLWRRAAADEQLVARVAGGDASAAASIAARYGWCLEAFAIELGLEREEARWTVLESLAAAEETLHAGLRPRDLRVWLYRLVRNRVLRLLDERRCIGVSMVRDAAGDPLLVVAEPATDDARLLTVLLLRDLEHLSYPDLASAFGTSVDEVRQLVQAARSMIVQTIERAERHAQSRAVLRQLVGAESGSQPGSRPFSRAA